MTGTNSSDDRITPDTSLIIKMSRNPNYRDMLRVRGDFDGKIALICKQGVKEASKHGVSRERIRSMFEALNASVVFVDDSAPELRDEAEAMVARNSGLHTSDSKFTARAKGSGSHLYTLDHAQAEAGAAEGIRVVNHDKVLGEDGWFHGKYGRGHFGPRPAAPTAPATLAPKKHRRHLRRRAYPHPPAPTPSSTPTCSTLTKAHRAPSRHAQQTFRRRLWHLMAQVRARLVKACRVWPR